MMNILVTGANGQLGTEFRNLSKNSSHKCIFTDVNSQPGIETVYLDITNIDAIRIIAESEKIDAIVNCAAYTNVDKAEDDLSMADLLNHSSAENLAIVAKERGIALIHISTDYVFSGSASSPRKEEDEKEPIGVYGATKLAGERAIQESGCRYLIFRTSWLYSPYGKNFVKTMISLTKEKPEIKVVFDQVGTPTYAKDLATLILKVLSEGLTSDSGIYHYSNEGAISWYDFAKEISALAGTSGKILPCLSEEFPTKSSRPHYSVLDKTKVKKEFGIEIPYWRDSLKDCIERLK